MSAPGDGGLRHAGVGLALLAALVCFVALRAPRLDDPLLGMHDARMNESAAIARNFYEEGANPLLPRIDWRGSTSGYIEEAFQLYTWSVSLLYRVFGPREEVARALSMAAFLLAGVFLGLIARRVFGPRPALFAFGFFAVAPLGAYYSVGVQPDPLTLTLGLATLYAFVRWEEDGRTVWLVMAAPLLAATLAIQPMNLLLGLPIAFLCFRRLGWKAMATPSLWAVAVLALAVLVVWYAHAHQLWLEHGNSNGVWTQEWKYRRSELLLDPAFYRTLAERVVHKMTTWVGLPLLLIGFLASRRQRVNLFHWWTLGMAVSILNAPGSQLPHEYYQLPLVAITAAFMGEGLDRVLCGVSQRLGPGSARARWAEALTAGLVLAAILGLSVWTLSQRYRVPERAEALAVFAGRVQELTEPDALVALGTGDRRGRAEADAICCRHREPDGRYFGHEPVVLYQTHRKGWSLQIEDWNLVTVEALAGQGARYFISMDRQALEEQRGFVDRLAERHRLLWRDEESLIVELSPPGEGPGRFKSGSAEAEESGSTGS